MSWVSIDEERCNRCGICAERCERCFTNKENIILVHSDETCCNLCGHCVSLCPADAIHHNEMDMDNFPEVNERINYDPDDFIRFVRQRRSHRSFKKKKISQKDLGKLTELCRYIPTGSNLQTVEIKVLTNTEKIKKLSDLTVDHIMGIIHETENQVNTLSSQGKEIPEKLARRKELLDRYKMIGQARDLGFDPILHEAPVVMVFHSPFSPGTPKDDCVIAAQTVVLTAMTMGLGTCYNQSLEHSANNSPLVKEALNLPYGNKIYSVLIMGYPKLQFRRTVDRKPIKVQWEE